MERLTVSLLAACLVLTSPTSARARDVPESKDPIVLALHEWTGQQAVTHVAGRILEHMGYRVEYLMAGAYPAAIAIADGTIGAALELWDNNLGEFYPTLLAQGKIEDIGELGLDGFEGWLYPKYMEARCPGLPDWQAFAACSHAFAVSETRPAGRLLDYPAAWGTRGREIVEGERLPYIAVPAGSEGALVAEFEAAVARGMPLVMMFWSPHWLLYKHAHGWVEMPPEVIERYGVRKPRIFKATWPGLVTKWPAAYRFLKAFRMTNRTQEYLVGLIDGEGRSLTEVTRRWVEENESVWKPWVEETRAEP